MKKRVLGLVFILTLSMASVMSVSATEAVAEEVEVAEEAQVDEKVQAAYEEFCKMGEAITNRDLEALKAASKSFESLAENLSDEQQEALAAMYGEEFYSVLMDSAAIVYSAELKEAFVANKNASTAKEFVENYELHFVNLEWGEEFTAVLEEMIPDIHTAYEEAVTYMPSENVMKVYNAYTELEVVLEFAFYDDDFMTAFEGFEAVLDAYNELSEEELEVLASLVGEEDAEAVFSRILGDWITANIIHEVGQLYDAYGNDPNEETAKAFVEYYDSIYNDPEYVDEELRADVEAFFADIHDLYAQLKVFVNDDGSAEDEKLEDENVEDGNVDGETTGIEAEDDRDASPKTGDEASVIWPMTTMLMAAAVVVVTKRKRA